MLAKNCSYDRYIRITHRDEAKFEGGRGELADIFPEEEKGRRNYSLFAVNLSSPDYLITSLLVLLSLCIR
jgi:hypothetical protein